MDLATCQHPLTYVKGIIHASASPAVQPAFAGNPPSHGKSVAIIGGGPAGLTLARLLQLAHVAVRVYERDVGPEARTQGGSLDLHEGTGQLALKRCRLERQFDSLSRPEGQAAMVYDRLSVLRASLTAADDGGSKPEIDRLELRGLLLGALEEGTVIWDRRLDEITPLDGAGPAQGPVGSA
jgi:2-polyprenyl-6-methoxyphenol hydroxylase-like FAD-dependent oxidoreductase